MARNWLKLIKKMKIWFGTKSNIFCIDWWLILSQISSNSIYYIYTTHTTWIKVEKLAGETLLKFKKSVAYKQLVIIDPACFNCFWGFKHIPWHPWKHSRPLHCPKPSRNSKTRIRFVLLFQNSIFNSHALLTCFVVVFVIRRKFANVLGSLIVFLWPETRTTMIRVSWTELGFL